MRVTFERVRLMGGKVLSACGVKRAPDPVPAGRWQREPWGKGYERTFEQRHLLAAFEPGAGEEMVRVASGGTPEPQSVLGGCGSARALARRQHGGVRVRR